MIRELNHENRTVFFVADDLGMPVSFGYPAREIAEEVAQLIEASEGQASIPAGINVEAILPTA